MAVGFIRELGQQEVYYTDWFLAVALYLKRESLTRADFKREVAS